MKSAELKDTSLSWMSLAALLWLLFAACLMADPICQDTIDMSSSNVTTTWTLSSRLSTLRNVQSIFVVNTSTAHEILVNCSGSATVTPSNTSRNNIPVGGPGSDTTWALDQVNGGSACWYKANGANITSGIFKLCVSGN